MDIEWRYICVYRYSAETVFFAREYYKYFTKRKSIPQISQKIS